MVVLYVYCIQQRFCSPETYGTYFDAAVKCQNQIYHVAAKESLHQRYYVVLEELRCEAIKQTQNRSRSAATGTLRSQHAVQNTVLPATHEQHSVTEETGFDHPLDTGLNNGNGNDCRILSGGSIFGASHNSLMAEMTSWGEIASLVISAQHQIREPRI